MSARPLAVVVLAAGKGTRMKSRLPKVLHRVAGLPMVRHVLAAAGALAPQRTVVVVGPGMEAVAQAVAPHETVVQQHQLGTGDAVMAAHDLLADFDGDILVCYGDTPLVTAATLGTLVNALARPVRGGLPALAVLGMRPGDPTGYGRLVTTAEGVLLRIVEEKDATDEQKRIPLCNAGLMAVSGAHLFTLLGQVGTDNAKGEYYLTDLVGIAAGNSLPAALVEGPAEEAIGVNSRAELAVVEKLMQHRLRARAMAEGATLTDPDTVHLSMDTRLGRDVVVGQNVVFGPGVEIADGVEILPFCHLEGVKVEEGARIGPFARLRPGSVIGADAHIGNFVEVKKSSFGRGAKANHLAYVGDATVGARANIGAGTVTCNYDGFDKHQTVIGEGTFIGTNSSLVAPVTVGDGAYTAAGSTITDDVPADALALGRGRQSIKEGWAITYRADKQAARDARSGKTRPDG